MPGLKIRCVLSVLLLPLILLLGPKWAESSWLINRERFHVSVHGQLSCLECHTNYPNEQIHPNPENVNKTLKDFFFKEQCTDCHIEILEEADQGIHGGEKIDDPLTLNNCIKCHDPHYQPPYSQTPDSINLDQPVEIKCRFCHDVETVLPECTEEDKSCMDCHGLVPPEGTKANEKISNFCFHCHGSKNEWKASFKIPLMDQLAFHKTTHSDIACTVCHPNALKFGHGAQQISSCSQCHPPHDGKVAHDAHFKISCQACHLSQIIPVKDPLSGMINWQKDWQSGSPSPVHNMKITDDKNRCGRCHVSGNLLGASTIVLPAKSVICMPCHAATLSVGDTTTTAALSLFILGILSISSVWFSGALEGKDKTNIGYRWCYILVQVFRTLFSIRIMYILKATALDGLLQYRLFQISKSRWLVHAMVVFPFLFRFVWGMAALVSSLLLPTWDITSVMLNKNHPLTACLFDLSGIITISGVALILWFRHKRKVKHKINWLPKADWLGYSLLGSMMLTGFILEGMRIAMTGTPEGSAYAFAGYTISRLFVETALNDIYGLMWYLHAVNVGAFLAYLPFSRMIHMILAPVSLAVNAGIKNRHRLAYKS
ncbi:MAG: hypothetical protein HOJ48_20415 [Desulfobacula sp.]|nr:hypothetical protein [Desulfobacula sp.]